MKGNPFELTMYDIMTMDVVTVKDNETVSGAVKMMEGRGIGAVVVVGDSNDVIGIFSERDVLFRVVAQEKDPLTTTMADVMTVNPVTISPDISVFEAFELAHEGKFRHIPIVKGGALVGIVSARDINSAFYSEKNALNEMKMKFTMITSHELKTPCAIINSCMYLLRDDIKHFDKGQRDLFNTIDKNVNRLKEITNNLSKLYSVSLPDTEINLELSSIEKIIKSAVKDITPIIKGRHQNLTVNIDGKISNININRRGIKEVIMNLLLNAVRFTQDNGTIDVRVLDENDNVLVVVEDNGIGIPENELNRIFESFYEVQDVMNHSSGSVGFKSGGLGIGLSIAKNTIESHNGRIWAESEEGNFSRFIFTLPKV